MLQVKQIKKQYITGELTQTALDDVSLNFRDNEFVAILGPSGSGKTTLLNIVGGLDRYDSGDLIINGISTKKYKDRDWDAYRNHTIGFVFQSYNLIPHQNILSNVELALTISGISKSERKQRAKEALEKVGLGEHIHKRPNQLSGGQMQRVAIARALVNNPDILLADEPTGALDSETSVQVMDMLKEVAKDRLVIMVTHNPELAEEYANRIVKLKDGKIISDSNPLEPDEKEKEPEHKKMGKTSMSFLTSLALSFNNLRTKKGRTLLTSFAGSIGIIGIALILSISNGVNTYINDIQRDAMASYPITIDAQSIDLSSLMETASGESDKEVDHKKDAVYSDGTKLQSFSDFTSSITKNNLTKFKKYLDNSKSEIHDYVGENGIVYSYDTKFDAYSFDPDNKLVNMDGSGLNEEMAASFGINSSGGTNSMSSMSMMSSRMNNNNLSQLLPGSGKQSVSPAITENYDVVYGKYPANYDEIVLVLDKDNEVAITTIYEMGLLPSDDYKDIMKKIGNGEKVEINTEKWSYEDFCKTEIFVLPACDRYVKNENGLYVKAEDDEEIAELVKEKAIKLKITGVIRPKEENDTRLITTSLGYTKALTDYLIDYAENSDVVKAQKADNTKNVINGMSFDPKNDEEKIADVKKYFEEMGVSEKAKMIKTFMNAASAQNSQITEQLSKMTEEQLAAQMDMYLKSAQDKILLTMYDNYISPGDYEDNLSAFGVVSLDAPSSIAIYADSFENKDNISNCIEEYNKKAEENDKITYTDYVGLLMSSVTTIVNVISYVLIAFVAVSLIVSSIMIGIITYISVLERTKEIGILRAIGASKKNISQVFNAETFIIGLCSGLIGIGLTLLILLPGNAVIHSLAGTNDVSAALPPVSAVILIALSIVLTLIGGLIPAKKAAKQDPVKALRTD
ncbi:MAG: ABC transporter ATP-binding protein/permease [Clostridia bacterium]|nr:ABC transporter ATP-binding protein/permease [Clostridia bacterium]